MSSQAARGTRIRSPGGPLAIAIDVGSSSVRAELFDANGNSRRGSFAQVHYLPTIDGQGGVSIEFPRLLAVVAATLDAFVARAGADLRRVAGVGISCFLHSLAATDSGGRAITPLLTWADTSSAEAAAELRARLDGASLWQETGAPLHASYWPAKIVRLRRSVGTPARGWAGAPELLYRELTGSGASDLSQASGSGLLDRRTGTWHAGLLEVLDIDPAALPQLAAPGSSGRLTDWAAARWPALAGVPWFTPLSDASCGNVGLGCLAGGPAALQVGTSGAVRAIVADPVPPIPAGLFGHRLADGSALVGGQLSEGGGVAAALARLLGRSMRALEADAAALPPDDHGLTALPYLAGERGPGYHDEARGVIAGFSLSSSPADVFLAVLEAIALDFAALDRRLAAALGGSPRIVASGGALARSPLLVDILAAALGRPIWAAAEGEASSRGAAILALATAGTIGSPADVPAPATRQVIPDPERVARYRVAAARQAELYRRILGS
jgi:gluconokinase